MRSIIPKSHPSPLRVIRRANLMLLPVTALACLGVWIADRFGLSAEWLEPGFFAFAVLLQAILFVATEPERLRSGAAFGLRVLAHYPRVVRPYLRWALAGFTSIVFAWLLVLPGDRLPVLLAPSLAAFAVSAVLAALDPSNRFVFFHRVRASRASLFAILLGAAFAGGYSYRALFARLDLPAPVLSACLVALVFVLIASVAVVDLSGEITGRRKSSPYQAWRYGVSAVSAVMLALVARAWQVAPDPVSPESTTPAVVAQDFASDIDRLLVGLDSLSPAATGSVASDSGTLAPPPQTRRIGDIYPGTRYLGLGDTGEDVLWVQRLLAREGYYSGPLDSSFTQATGAALAKFIREKALTDYDYTQLGPQAMGIFKDIMIEERP